MNLIFVNSKAIIKQGRKIIAKVYDRKVFYPANNIKSGYSYPYSIELNVGSRECSNLGECIDFIKKYT